MIISKKSVIYDGKTSICLLQFVVLSSRDNLSVVYDVTTHSYIKLCTFLIIA